MTKDLARKLAITILDDEHGISEAAFNLLQEACECHCSDIFKVVSSQDDRYFLNEDTAKELSE